jgi:hypothetical protein
LQTQDAAARNCIFQSNFDTYDGNDLAVYSASCDRVHYFSLSMFH